MDYILLCEANVGGSDVPQEEVALVMASAGQGVAFLLLSIADHTALCDVTGGLEGARLYGHCKDGWGDGGVNGGTMSGGTMVFGGPHL